MRNDFDENLDAWVVQWTELETKKRDFGMHGGINQIKVSPDVVSTDFFFLLI